MIKFILLVIISSVITSFDSRCIFYNKPEYAEAFIMPVEDVFSITGRGVVATGNIEKGSIKIGDSVELVGINAVALRATVTGIEAFRKIMDEAKKGDNVGLLLRGVNQSQLKRGMVICTPGLLQAHTEFKCIITLKTKEEGGRSTPVFANYRPQLRFRTHLVSGEVLRLEGIGELKPGDSSVAVIKVSEPAAMANESEFEIKEGGRVVGTGRVNEIIQ